MVPSRYLNDFQESIKNPVYGDYSDSRWNKICPENWGSVGFGVDNVVWGDNYHGSIRCLSAVHPSFPMLTLHLNSNSNGSKCSIFIGWCLMLPIRVYLPENGTTIHYRPA